MIKVSFQGSTIAEVVNEMEKFISTVTNKVHQPIVEVGDEVTPVKSEKPKKPKAMPAPTVELDDVVGEESESTNGSDDSFDFDEPSEDEEPKSVPVKKVKDKALTEEDIMNAARAHAGKHGKAATQNLILHHFKIKSVSQIKEADRVKAMKVLKV